MTCGHTGATSSPYISHTWCNQHRKKVCCTPIWLLSKVP